MEIVVLQQPLPTEPHHVRMHASRREVFAEFPRPPLCLPERLDLFCLRQLARGGNGKSGESERPVEVDTLGSKRSGARANRAGFMPSG